MHATLEQFTDDLAPGTRDETPGSLYYQVTNMTAGVLVVDRTKDDCDLVEACFAAHLPVAVKAVDVDNNVPRIEYGSSVILGKSQILKFLSDKVNFD